MGSEDHGFILYELRICFWIPQFGSWQLCTLFDKLRNFIADFLFFTHFH
jgi:hypothetical protein